MRGESRATFIKKKNLVALKRQLVRAVCLILTSTFEYQLYIYYFLLLKRF